MVYKFYLIKTALKNVRGQNSWNGGMVILSYDNMCSNCLVVLLFIYFAIHPGWSGAHYVVKDDLKLSVLRS